MDPNSLSHLDPKLRETYERVMGASKPSPSAPATPIDGPSANSSPQLSSTPTPNDAAPLESNPKDPSTDAKLQSEPLAPSSSVADPEPQPQTVNISQPIDNSHEITQTNEHQGHQGLLKVFYILGTTVFFMVYVFFWLKIFNISLPF